MSELLDSFSAGILLSLLPFFFYLPPLPNLSAPISLLQCQTRPLTPQNISTALFLFPCGSLSPACTLSHHVLPLSVSLFSFPSHFLCVFLKRAKRASRRPPRAGLRLAHTALGSVPLFPVFPFSILSLFCLIPQSVSLSVSQGPPHFEVTQWDAINPAGNICFVTFLSLHLMCSEGCWRRVVVGVEDLEFHGARSKDKMCT